MDCSEARAILEILRLSIADYKNELEKFEATGNESSLHALEYLKRDMEIGVKNLREGTEVHEYRVYVDYAPIPSFEELNKQFDFVTHFWDQNDNVIKNHESVRGLAEVPGEKTFFIKRFQAEIDSKDVIGWAKKNGYRPAILKEVLAFAKAHPDIQKKFWIISLGSYSPFNGNENNRNVPVLSEESGERRLRSKNYTLTWWPEAGHLLIRE